MLTRVSSIESFRRWRLDDDATPDDLVERLTSFHPTEPMLAGTAFHRALELAVDGEYTELEANGYTFILPDADIALPTVRELRAFRNYGEMEVTGQVDGLHGLRIEDHKTTASFNPDGYLEGCQWRFYLDIFEADVFRWNVFQISPVPRTEKTYNVKPPQILEQCRYPGLHEDCIRLASDYYAFASRFMPNYKPQLESA
jgi:hypothetical protein